MIHRNYIISICIFLFILSNIVTVASSTNNSKNILIEESKYQMEGLKILYVDDNNTEGPWEGTIEHPFQFIQDAINKSLLRGTVYVLNGTYYENIEIWKALTLIGEDKNSTIIDGDNNDTVIYISDHNVTVDGFTIKNSGDKYHRESGICILEGRHYNTIKNNIFKNIPYICILLDVNSDNNIISNNYMEESTTGIEISFNSINNTATYNHIEKCNRGIEIYASSNNKASCNNINNCKIGIIIDYSSNKNNITNNNLLNISKFGIYIGNSNKNKIENNNFIKCKTQARFVQSWFNKWKGNYWEITRFSPKIIYGRVGPIFYLIPWVNFDWCPAKVPYVI